MTIEAKKVTRNGLPSRYEIEGTNLVTDSAGIERIETLKKRYCGDKPMPAIYRAQLRKDIQNLFKQLLLEGRLFRRDGVPFFGVPKGS